MANDSSPESAESPDKEQKKPQLSAAQVLASSAAAVSAAVVASLFGVAGTLIGAAITSIVATVGTALYAQSLQVARERVTYRLRQPAADDGERPGVRTVAQTALDELRHHARRLPWRAIAMGTVTVFVVAVAVLTLFEGLVGRTIAALVGPDEAGKGQTSIGRAVGVERRTPLPTPSPSPSTVPTSGLPTAITSPPAPTEDATASPESPTVSPPDTTTDEATPTPTAPEPTAPELATPSPS
jgi:hypothetical protein